MRVYQPRRGLSLIETIFAMFYLTLILLVVSSMFDSSFRAEMRNDKRQVATVVAQKHIDRIRAWAIQGSNFSDWTSIDGVTAVDPDCSAFDVTTRSEPCQQLSPCSEVELPYSTPRTMTSSVRKIEVEVFSQDGVRVSLTSSVAKPPAVLDHLIISPVAVPNPVGKEGTATFRVAAYDSGGAVIPDVFFEWNVLPGTGNGKIAPTRSGNQAVFTHHYQLPNSTVLYFPALTTCSVEARAVYRGVEKTDTFQLNLVDT